MSVSHLRHLVRLGFRLALVLGFSLSASAQTVSANSAPDIAFDSSSDLLNWAVPFHHNLLQPDARLIAAFVRPWLFKAQIFSASASISNKSTRTLPKAKTYKLTPDPLNWSLSSTSPDEDDYAYLPDARRTGYINTAQRMGELSSGHPVAAHVPAKYDPERIGDREVGEGINFYSIEKEMALGRELSLQVEQSAGLLSVPV